MIWFLVWLAFVMFVVWLFTRSMRIVWKQQKAWSMFARKHNLSYTKGAWYQAPVVDGEIRGRRMRLYVEEVVDPVLRLREFRTTLEVYLKTGLPTGIAIGSRAYAATINDIENVESVTLPQSSEFAGIMAVAREVDIYETWKNTHEETLKTFFAQKKTERLLMGHETDGFLIVQSADNLDEVSVLNAKVKTLFQWAQAIEMPEEGLDEGRQDDVEENETSPDMPTEDTQDTVSTDVNETELKEE